MELECIDSIWFKRLTEADFFGIERKTDAGPQGGGGGRYIDIPVSARNALFDFLGDEKTSTSAGPWPRLLVPAAAIGSPDDRADIVFEHRGEAQSNRYRTFQARQGENARRHPAWTAARGFPQAPDDVDSTQAAASHMGSGVAIYLVRTSEGQYFAGFVQGSQMPVSWPRGANLERLFEDSPGDRIVLGGPAFDIPDVVAKIFEAWARKPNVLLYGPPGTGKTYAMSIVRRLLELGLGAPIIGLDREDANCPFKVAVPKSSLPDPVEQDWATFHQSFSYEDFILGLRPRTIGAGGFDLKPRVGKLLELAIRVNRDEEPAQSAVLFIDEVNRGNVARIFGEFITFMDFDYRDVDSEGADNPSRLPVPFPSVDTSSGETEELQRPSSAAVKLEIPWFFPRHVYTLSSMNSVDRTVAPLDSALSRRIERIELRPDMDLLATWLKVNRAQSKEKVSQYMEKRAEGAELPDLQANECAVLLLERINQFLASTLGPDFEIGHTYFFEVVNGETEADHFANLAVVWDRFIHPQLQERFVIRPEELFRVLKIGEADAPDDYAFRARTGWFDEDTGDRPTAETVFLADLASTNPEMLRRSLRFLACP